MLKHTMFAEGYPIPACHQQCCQVTNDMPRHAKLTISTHIKGRLCIKAQPYEEEELKFSYMHDSKTYSPNTRPCNQLARPIWWSHRSQSA